MGNRINCMKEVKIFSNANLEILEDLAKQAVNDPNFLEIHYSGHAIMVIYQVPGKEENPIPSGSSGNLRSEN
jgi:hypothetical protein